MVGLGGGSGNPVATEGTSYGEKLFDGSSDPEIVIPIGDESSSWIIKALSSNTGDVYVGWDDDVDSSNGFPLASGEAVSVDLDNSNQNVWAVSDNSNEGVRFLAVE